MNLIDFAHCYRFCPLLSYLSPVLLAPRRVTIMIAVLFTFPLWVNLLDHALPVHDTRAYQRGTLFPLMTPMPTTKQGMLSAPGVGMSLMAKPDNIGGSR